MRDVELPSLGPFLTKGIDQFRHQAKMLTGAFSLPRRDQLLGALLVLLIGFAGFYLGLNNERFLSCTDFERIGDYQPGNCTP